MTATAWKIDLDEPASSWLDPQIIVPVQFFDLAAGKTAKSGEKRLVFAVLEEAVAGFPRHLPGRGSRGRRLFMESHQQRLLPQGRSPLAVALLGSLHSHSHAD